MHRLFAGRGMFVKSIGKYLSVCRMMCVHYGKFYAAHISYIKIPGRIESQSTFDWVIALLMKKKQPPIDSEFGWNEQLIHNLPN